jgi:hypothetical protein
MSRCEGIIHHFCKIQYNNQKLHLVSQVDSFTESELVKIIRGVELWNALKPSHRIDKVESQIIDLIYEVTSSDD